MVMMKQSALSEIMMYMSDLSMRYHLSTLTQRAKVTDLYSTGERCIKSFLKRNLREQKILLPKI